MRLQQAARFFDRTLIQDAYSGLGLGRAQFDLFDDSRRDAYGVERRILSCAPGVQMPARHVITEPLKGEQWIVGSCQPDYFKGAVIRNKYVLHRADDLARVRTAGALLEGAAALEAYANAAWVKDTKQAEESSNAPSMYAVFFGRGEAVALNSVIEMEGMLLLAKGRYESSADYLVIEAEDITGAAQDVGYVQRTYNPVADSHAEVTKTVKALVIRWQALYENTSAASLDPEQGDKVALVSKVAVPAPKVGDRVVGAVTREVRAIEDRGDAWALQIRSG